MAEESFLGIGWGFPPEFRKAARGVVTLADEADIKNSLEILLTTRPGERIMQPKYGCDLSEMQFEPLSVSLQTYIRELVFTAIYYYEPRIKPENVTLSVTTEEGIIMVEVEYLIRSTNTRHNMVFPYYLNEANNLNP